MSNITKDATAWRHGTRRVGNALEVRDRWQGFLGPNSWLTIPLGVVAGFAAWNSVTESVCDPADTRILDAQDLGGGQITVPSCDSWVTQFRGVENVLMSSLLLSIACTVVLVVAGLRFYPIVRFGPDSVRWRNWFRWKEISTGRVARLDIQNYNPRAWVPAVTAAVDDAGSRRHRKFIATFAFRRTVAVAISDQVSSWAADHDIAAHLPPEHMTWRFRRPDRDSPTTPDRSAPR